MLETHMSYSLNSLKGVIFGIIQGTSLGVITGDARSLDYSSYVCQCCVPVACCLCWHQSPVSQAHCTNTIPFQLSEKLLKRQSQALQ